MEDVLHLDLQNVLFGELNAARGRYPYRVQEAELKAQATQALVSGVFGGVTQLGSSIIGASTAPDGSVSWENLKATILGK